MSFRDNLQHVCSTHDLSQAQLAALLGVSRQSVAKWEAERSYPEMDKLIKLCDLFACSLDDLVRGDLTQDVSPIAEAIEVEAEVADGPAAVEVADACGYDEHMRRRAWDIAAGVATIVMSFGVNFFIVGGYGSMTAGVSIVIHLIGVAVGLCFFVPAHRSHAAFREEHPVVEDFYAPQEKAGPAAGKRVASLPPSRSWCWASTRRACSRRSICTTNSPRWHCLRASPRRPPCSCILS